MKDPAALFYIDTWLTSTAEMDSDVRGWYLNLILHQYDKKDLPNDVEKLAVLAGVKFSEFDKFKQVFEQVFKQKFEQNENGRLENNVAKEILRKRELFKDKRSNSGKLSYFLKYIKAFKPKAELVNFIKENVDLTDVDLKSEQVLKQVFEQMSELYINGDGNKDINENKDTWKTNFETYKTELRIEFEKLVSDREFIKQQEKYYPDVDIKLSIEKACVNFWATEAGWKKKKSSRISNIDWKATLTNAIGMNRVFKSKEIKPTYERFQPTTSGN